MRIVQIALKEYFVYGKPIRDTILNHSNIFDFCLRLKTNSKITGYFTYRGEKKELQRTTRYYISNDGGWLTREFENGQINDVNKGYAVTIFNKYEEKVMSEYDINYNFYINEVNKIKSVIEAEKGQTSLYDLFGI